MVDPAIDANYPGTKMMIVIDIDSVKSLTRLFAKSAAQVETLMA